MKWHRNKIWSAVMAISIAAALISAVATIFAVRGDDTLHTILLLAAMVLFVACAIFARMLGSKMDKMQEGDDEVKCMRMKKPGIEKADEEEIVPKGKMPKV